MVTPKDKWKRYVNQVTLIEHFHAVLFPIDVIALLDRLPESGWVVPRRVEGFGDEKTISLTEAASKGNAQLLLDAGKRLIGVTSNELQQTLVHYRELRSLVREVSDFTPMVRTDYVEFRYIGWLRGQSDPVKVFASWWKGNERASRWGELLGRRMPSDSELLSPYGLRFASSGQEANRPNWAELSIVPVNVAGHHRYHFDLLYRNEDSTATEQVAEAADEILQLALAEIEKAQ